MARWYRSMLLLLALSLGLLGFASVAAPAAAAQQTEEEVPPGNPVIGDERPGDIEPENNARYGLWALVAICLIGAGVLLIKIERWEARRLERAE